jgi:type II secretory pathway component PulJ
MIEEARNTPPVDAEAPAAEFASNQAMENAALAGAAAIQRLVAECNGLRNRLSLQETELVRLRGANESLRRRLALLHQRYVELAKKILGQLEQFDGTIREAGQVTNDENDRQEEPMLLHQRPQDGNGPVTPKPNGRDLASVMSQAPRAPVR